MVTKQYFRALKVPILVAIVNIFPGNWLYSHLPTPVGSGIFNLIRTANVFYAGWLVVQYNSDGLRWAALSGPILLLIDHVLLKGGYYLIAQILDPATVHNEGFLAFSGVIVSYFMSMPLLVIVGFLGGWLSRRKLRKAGESNKKQGMTKSTNLPISIILALLLPMVSFAADKSAPSTPKEIISAAKSKGATQVIMQLFQSNTWNTYVYPGISSGDPQWLEVAQTLYPAADAGGAEEIADALSLALLKRPYAVLPVLKNLWWKKDAGICYFGWDSEFPNMNVRSYINQLEQALGNASNKENAELRKKCIKGIEKTRKELHESN